MLRIIRIMSIAYRILSAPPGTSARASMLGQQFNCCPNIEG